MTFTWLVLNGIIAPNTIWDDSDIVDFNYKGDISGSGTFHYGVPALESITFKIKKSIILEKSYAVPIVGDRFRWTDSTKNMTGDYCVDSVKDTVEFYNLTFYEENMYSLDTTSAYDLLSGMTYPFTIGGILSEITSTYGHAFDTGNISSALLAQKIYTWDYKAGYTLRSLIGDIAEASCTFVQCDYTLNSFDFKTLAERVPTIELTSDNYRNRTTSTYEVPRPTQVQVRTSDKIVTATVSGQTAKDTNLYVIDGNPIFENMSETDIAVHVHNMAASIVGNIYYYVNKCDVVDNYVTATKTSYINLGDIITVDGGKKTIVTSISYSSSGFTIKCDGEESPYVTETQTGIKRIGTLTWDAYTAVGSASSINTTVQFVKAAGSSVTGATAYSQRLTYFSLTSPTAYYVTTTLAPNIYCIANNNQIGVSEEGEYLFKVTSIVQIPSTSNYTITGTLYKTAQSKGSLLLTTVTGVYGDYPLDGYQDGLWYVVQD